MSYNGWPNYQTFVVFSWLANDEKTYGWITKEVIPSAPPKRGLEPINVAGYAIKDFVEGLLWPEEFIEGSLKTDLLQSALSQVHWWAVGKAFMEGQDE